MLGMLLVNYIGGYHVALKILKHTHDYCSYADTIMPQFLFAAGFAMRLSLGRRLESGGKMPWGRAIRRILGLAFVAIAWYSFSGMHGIIGMFQKESVSRVLYVLFKRNLLQTLLHIAITSLWILPVIVAPWKVRLGYAVASGALHVVLSYWFNYEWVYSDPSGIDGGPLGFLTWSIPALCGTLACDAVKASGIHAVKRIAVSGFFVMLLGWAISCGTTLYNELPAPPVAEADVETKVAPVTESDAGKTVTSKLKPEKYAPDPVLPTLERLRAWDGTVAEPPFVPPPDLKHRKWNYWMMSQRGGTVSYTTFAAGFSLVVYALFLWACDGRHWRLGLFRTLGTNSLAAYMLSDVPGWLFLDKVFPKDSSAIWTIVGFLVLTLFVYGCCRLMERMGWYIRV